MAGRGLLIPVLTRTPPRVGVSPVCFSFDRKLDSHESGDILQVRAAVHSRRHDMPWGSLLRVHTTRGRARHCPIVTVQDVFARRFFRERGKVLWLVLAEWIKSRIREVRYFHGAKEHAFQMD